MSRPQTCSRCGQEVRYGVRGSLTGYMHRDPETDHMPVFGGPSWTAELQAGFDASLADMAARGNAKDRDAPAVEKEVYEEIPDPEIRCEPVEPDSFPPRSGIRQIVNLVDRTDGWERRRLTRSRGPYIGSSGKVLSISDSVVLGARGPEVDSGVRVAVASWRDGAFDFAYTGILKDGIVSTNAVNSSALKAWIKDPP